MYEIYDIPINYHAAKTVASLPWCGGLNVHTIVLGNHFDTLGNRSLYQTERQLGSSPGAYRLLPFWAKAGDCSDVTLTIPERSLMALIQPVRRTVNRRFYARRRMSELIEGTALHRGYSKLDRSDIYGHRGINLVDYGGGTFVCSKSKSLRSRSQRRFGRAWRGLNNRASEITERCLRGRFNGTSEGSTERIKRTTCRRSRRAPCITRAGHRPEVNNADEPVSARRKLRRPSRSDLRVEARYTIAIVTHNMQRRRRVSDRTAFLRGTAHWGRPHRSRPRCS